MNPRELLDAMKARNAAEARRMAGEIAARLDSLEAGEVVLPMIRRPAVYSGDGDAEGFDLGRAMSDALWAGGDEVGLRVRALIEARPKPRVRVGAAGDLVVAPPVPTPEEDQG